MAALDHVRMVIGAVFVLFAPGFAWSLLFFPRRRLGEAIQQGPRMDWIERGVVSVGLSAGIVAIVVLLLGALFRMPFTTLNTVLTLVILTGAPLLLRYILNVRRRARAPTPPA